MSFNDLISAIGPVLQDNTTVALDIESTDGKDFIMIDTSDGAEILALNGGGSAGQRLQVKAGVTQFAASGYMAILAEDPTATNPVFCPRNNDTDTGIGSAAADQLSLIAGGEEVLRCLATNGNAELLLPQETGFIDDPDTMMRSLGANQIEFRCAGTDIFRIGPTGAFIENGNFGVGTLTPATKLDVQGAVTYYAGTGSDTATSEPVYLADTNGTMIIDFDKGNFGDITLAANVTAVKFFNAPADGSVTTVTAKITQDSSARTFDYSDSAVTVYSDGGSTAVTGEIKFAGGAHHVQSTGSGAVDLVSFTCIPSGSTFNIYAAVVGQAFA
jgi:hypothetical protein